MRQELVKGRQRRINVGIPASGRVCPGCVFEIVMCLLMVVGLMAYLVCALLHPERF